MNLTEQTNRIRKIMGLMESIEDNEFEISYKFNPEVKELQKTLVDKGYYIGRFGKNKDGIDGKYGPFTQAAHKAYKEDISADEFNSETDKPEFKDVITKDESERGKEKNIIIGDSQTPYVDMNTSKASRISKNSGMSSLWEGGKTVSWLIDALTQYETDTDVKNVIIVIGTNGGFGKFLKDDIPQLFRLLREKFPNAKFFAVQGSWGWGGLKKIKLSDVKKYYKKFEDEGATIIEPPIGPIEPHGNHPIYSEIGSSIDSLL